MKYITHLILISLFFFGKITYSQETIIEPVTSLTYLDNGKVDSLIRSNITFPLSRNYYLILYNTNTAVTSWGNQITTAYRRLNEHNIRKCDEDVLVVFNNLGGYTQQDFKRLFYESFKFTDEEFSKVKYIINTDLYSAIIGNPYGDLVKLMHIHHGKLTYYKPPKIYNEKDFNFPHDDFKITPLTPVKINKQDYIIKAWEKIYSAGNNILINVDATDDILLINPNTGNIEHKFVNKEQNPTQLYCEYIVRDSPEKCAYAKKYNAIYQMLSRQLLDFRYFETGKNGNILAYAALEAAEPENEDYHYINDEGQKAVRAEGTRTLNLYDIMFMFDSTLNLIDVYPFKDGFNDKKLTKYLWGAIDYGYKVTNDSTIILQNTINEFNKFKWFKYPAFSEFKLNSKNEFSFNKNLSFNMDKSTFKIISDRWSNSIFFDLKNNHYAMFGSYNQIYDLGKGTNVSSIKGDGSSPHKKEIMNQKSGEMVYNYGIRTLSTIMSDKYVAILYNYKHPSNLLLEIKDQNLNTVYVSDLRHIPEFERFYTGLRGLRLIIQNDTIYFIDLDEEKQEHYIYGFKIEKSCN